MNHSTLTTPLLTARLTAIRFGEAALVVHYTHSPYHLARLESEMEALDRQLAGLRMALQAIRSRGEEPTS